MTAVLHPLTTEQLAAVGAAADHRGPVGALLPRPDITVRSGFCCAVAPPLAPGRGATGS
jgi:hypothetical protein